MVGLVGQNQPDLSKVSVLKQGSEAGNGLTLVGPRTCPKETIQDNSRGYGNSASRARKEEKPRGKPSSPELLSVGLTGFEPATSTPPVNQFGRESRVFAWFLMVFESQKYA